MSRKALMPLASPSTLYRSGRSGKNSTDMSSLPLSVSCMSAPIIGILSTSTSWGTSWPMSEHRSLYLKLMTGMEPAILCLVYDSYMGSLPLETPALP